MPIHAVLPLLACIFLATFGCTTVSTQSWVISQAGVAGVGTSATVAASAPTAAPLQGEFLAIDKWSTTLVTAKAVPKLGEVREISDRFNFEGRIYLHVTFSSRPGVNGGQPNMEVKWYSGDKLVSIQRAVLAVSKSPYYLTSSTSGTALGAGKAKVELVANGAVLASKEFEVTEK